MAGTMGSEGLAEVLDERISLSDNFGQPWVLTTVDFQETTHPTAPTPLIHQKPSDSQTAFAAYGILRNVAFSFPCSLQQRGGKLHGRKGLRTLECAGALTVGRWELLEIQKTDRNRNNTTAPESNWSGTITQPESISAIRVID